MSLRTPVLFTHDTPHGRVTAVAVDDVTVARTTLAQFPDDERALATSYGDRRLCTFVAGRVALRHALRAHGVHDDTALLRNDRGAPVVPPGLQASVSHKDDVAVALVRAVGDGFVGVDVEGTTAGNTDIQRHVLTVRERAALAPLDDVTRGLSLMQRFSLKESLYKALDPWVRRYVGFLEVEAWPQPDGTCRFELALKGGEGPFLVEGTWVVRDSVVVTTACVRRGAR
jgi:4'-phosphopantetheinyl transferase EntD